MGCGSSTSTPSGVDSTSPFAFNYTLLKSKADKLGEGQFAVVWKARHKKTGVMYAVKCVKKQDLTEEDHAALLIEIDVMKQLDHPNLVKLIDFYEDVDYFYLVMELMTGGELFTRIVEREKYSEEDAQVLVRTLTTAIQYCHSQGVVHRDLKPENILLADPSYHAPLKIADFGFAKFDLHGRQLSTACGTPGYVAPEILKNQKYGKEVDVWSLGVIFYILLCGYPPFHDSNQAQLYELIKVGNYEFDPEDWSSISEEAKDLIRHILEVDPRKRYTTQQILAHPWVTSKVSDAPLPSTIGQLKIFNARRKFKAGVNAVRTMVRVRMMTAALGAAAAAASAEETKTEDVPAAPSAAPPGASPAAGNSAFSTPTPNPMMPPPAAPPGMTATRAPAE